ncbi:unnamed protein product, partial [Closterium sp. NIES-53]
WEGSCNVSMNGSESARREPVSARSVDGKEQEKWGWEQDREEPEEESAEGCVEENDGGKDGREDEDHYARGCFKNLDSLKSACASAGNTCMMALDSSESACAAARIRNGMAWARAFVEPADPSPASCEITAPSTQFAAPVDREIEREWRLLQEKGLEMGGAGYLAALLGGDAPNASNISDGESLLLGDSLDETRIVGGASNLAQLIRNTPDDPVMADGERMLLRDALEEGPVARNLAVVVGDALEGAMVQGGADDRAGLIRDEFGSPNGFPNGCPNGFPNGYSEKMPLHSHDFGCAGNRKLAGRSGETGEEGERREKAWKEGEEGMQGDAEVWDVVPSYIQEVVAAASCESGNAGMDTWLLEDIMPLDG